MLYSFEEFLTSRIHDPPRALHRAHSCLLIRHVLSEPCYLGIRRRIPILFWARKISAQVALLETVCHRMADDDKYDVRDPFSPQLI
jgi:hypothetical protein